jgi:hypothetical protein
MAALYEFARVDIHDGPPPTDMWRDWSEQVREVAPEVNTIPYDEEGGGRGGTGGGARL